MGGGSRPSHFKTFVERLPDTIARASVCPRYLFNDITDNKYMRHLTINTSKTPNGYSGSCDIIPGWVVAYEGDFGGFEDYVRESIDFYVECAKSDGEKIPEILTDSTVVFHYRFDVQSLLTHYQNIFSFSALQYITGVNQRQLWHYAAGRSKPRPKQAEKIVGALNRLGKELVSLSV